MLDIFISYSRKDKAFVQRLHAAIEAQGREAWVDWEGIPLTADWWAEIQAGIENANTFVFVISPDSAASTVCAQEVAHAHQHHKRIVPVVYRDVSPSALPAIIGQLNWVFCRESDDFEQAVDNLLTAIDTDYDWVKAHTRLIRRAVEWDKQGRDPSYLLRGTDLASAEPYLAQRDKEPALTALQIEYILSSRQQAEAERQKELAALADSRKARRRIVLIGLSLTMTLLIVIVNYIGIRPATTLIDLTSEVRFPTALTVGEAQKDLLLIFDNLRGYLLFGDETYRTGYRQNHQQFEANLQKLAQLYALSPTADTDGPQKLAELNTIFHAWIATTDQIVALPPEQAKREATILMSQAGPQIDEMQQLLADMSTEQEQLLTNDLNISHIGLEQAVRRSIFIGLLVIILGTIIIWIEIRGLPRKDRWQNLLGLKK